MVPWVDTLLMVLMVTLGRYPFNGFDGTLGRYPFNGFGMVPF